MIVKLGVGAYRELLMKDWDFCLTHFEVLELQDFVMPDNLENSLLVQDYKEMLDGYAGEVAIHGPYLNLVPTSLDKKVRELAEFRYLQSIDIAGRIGAGRVIIHSYYDPKSGFASYDDMWLKDNISFWSGFLEKVKDCGIKILLENCHDQKPATFARLISSINNPYFTTCLDIGHGNCLSPFRPEEWIAENPGCYFHITDNDGINDSHLLMGQGIIDFKKVAQQLSKLNAIYLVSEANAAFDRQLDSLRILKDMIGLPK